MGFLSRLKRLVLNVVRAPGRLEGVILGMDNQSQLINQKFEEIIMGLNNVSRLLSEGNRNSESILDHLEKNGRLLRQILETRRL